MVDFTKKIKGVTVEKRLNPIEIYESLDRRSEAGPLRKSQDLLLNDWFKTRRNEKNCIVKLHTGEGKTLIGLLMLQSRLNETSEASLYLCPNIYLANQVKNEAKKFGIKFCEIDNENNIPDSFVEGKSILITHVQKLFNARTRFGINNKSIDVGSIVLDDSHACIDSIRSSLTISIGRDHPAYSKLLGLFSNDLSFQGEGSYHEIENGEYKTMLPIPYWAWSDKCKEVTKILAMHSDDKEIVFVWDIVKNNIENSQAFISGTSIEILPYVMPINAFGSFYKARNRILMSATTQDDSFAIKGLGFDLKAVKTPLTNKELKWSGEKMILIPSLIDDDLDREWVVNNLMKKNAKRTFGVVVLAPGFRNNDQYEKVGCSTTKSNNIEDAIKKLKGSNFESVVVFSNRYDGIDLPDESCRILIIDSKPYFDSLSDRYEEECRGDSDIFNTKIAQKIEQGLGRSVRGEKDYSAIILTGGELVKFVKSKQTAKHFSAQTRKQIDIGLRLSEFAKEEISEEVHPKEAFYKLLDQLITRDEGWKDFYKFEMDEFDDDIATDRIYEVLLQEHEAEVKFYNGDVEAACVLIQKLADKFSSSPMEKGWYLQILARYKNKISTNDSNKIQLTAFKLNNQLLKPKEGVVYSKIEYINQNRISRIKEWIKRHEGFEELKLAVDGINANLSFGVNSDKFEKAIEELGFALGFESQRPDKSIRKGPDNLWCGVDDKYFLIECKNEVEITRAEISKHEAGQMNSHCGWFDETYPSRSCKRIIIIPTKKLSYYANFTHSVSVMRAKNLEKLKNNFKKFYSEMYKYNKDDISDELFQELINLHKLDLTSLSSEYTEDPVLTNDLSSIT